MNYLTIFFLFLSMSLHAQIEDGLNSQKKNSIGISLSTVSIGNSNSFNEAPTIGLDYRRLISNNSELRLALGYQHSNSSIYGSSVSLSAGINQFFFRSTKFGFYGTAELNYSNFPTLLASLDSNELISYSTDQIGIAISLGIEYNVSPRLNVFIEPRLMSLSIFESLQGRGEFQTNHLKFLKESRIGVKYRF